MSESALAQPEHRPAALQPPAREERSSTRPSLPAAPAQPVYGNAATARVAASEAGPAPSGLGPGSGAVDLVAAQKADEVFSALGWLNHEERALAALSGHDPAMRARIQLQFRERHGRDLADFLRAQLDGDWLVRAFALLHSYNYLEQHTRLALALIPPGVRSEEVLQVLGDVAVSRRRELKVLYELAFGTIGQGTLEKDLKAKLSGWRLQKSLALLDRDLTDADHLYFNSLAIVGTHTTEVVELIQRRWADPGTFGELIQQWDDYVTNHKHWSPDPPWTTLTLYEAMDSELSGEDWLLVKTVLVNYYQIKAGDFPGKTPEQAKQAEEEARLHVADDSLRAATTGERWWQGAGTDEAQAFRAITEIRKIWEERIARSKDADAKKDAEANWAKRRQEIEGLLAGETTKGSTEDRQVQLLLKGKTTVGGTSRADEIYLASQAAQSDRVVQLVTQTWAEGKMAALISAAATPVLDPEGKTLRPSFRLELVVPVTNGETWQRVTLLTDARYDDATRGANRLQFEIDRGNDESELKKVYQLLFMSSVSAPGLCDAVIAAYVKQRGLPAAGGANRAFLDHIRDRYASSYSYWLLLDLLEKSSDPTELYRRAHGRKAASETGLFHAIVQHFAERQDKETGEDTRAVVEESLATLSYVAQHQQGDPALATMQRLAGAANVTSLAAKEYQGFTARLDRLRAQEQAIAEAIATAIELAVEAALTIATAGMAGGALLASLASTVAGMVAREALLGQDYTLTSRENAERLVAVFATAGLGHLGGELAKSALGAERVATRAGQFVQHASSELMSQAGAVATKGAFSETGLTGGDLSATAISAFASVLGAGTTGVLKAGLAHDASLAAKLTANVRAHLAGGAVTSLGGLASELTASGVGDLTAAEIAAIGGKRVAETAVRGTVAGLKDTAAERAAEQREAAKHRVADLGAEPETAPAPTTPEPATEATHETVPPLSAATVITPVQPSPQQQPISPDTEVEEAFTKWQTPTGGAIEPPAGGSATSGPEHRAPLTPDDLFRSVVIPKRVEPEAVGVSAHSAVRLELAQAEATLATVQAAATAEPKNAELAKAVRRARWQRDVIANRLAVSALPPEAQASKGGLLDIRGTNTVAAIQIIDAQGNEIAVAVDNFKGGSRHAETEVLATFDRMIADKRLDPKRLIGATIHVVGDQVVCSDVCRPALRTWAADHEAKAVEGHLFTRPKYAGTGQATAKTTAKTFLQAPPPGQPSPLPLTHHQEKLY